MNIVQRKPSRHMPRFITQPMRWHIGLVGLIVLALAAAMFLTLSWQIALPTTASLLLLIVGVFQMNRSKTIHRQALVAKRSGDDLGQFARSFDVQTVNTWVIRAVYEDVQQNIATQGLADFPVRADDMLDVLLFDLSDDALKAMIVHIAQRTGRQIPFTKGTELVLTHTITIRELVYIFNRQPAQLGLI